jgi:hypothetical protein
MLCSELNDVVGGYQIFEVASILRVGEAASVSMLFFHLRLVSFSLGLPTNSVCISHLTHPCHMLCPMTYLNCQPFFKIRTSITYSQYKQRKISLICNIQSNVACNTSSYHHVSMTCFAVTIIVINPNCKYTSCSHPICSLYG